MAWTWIYTDLLQDMAEIKFIHVTQVGAYT